MRFIRGRFILDNVIVVLHLILHQVSPCDFPHMLETCQMTLVDHSTNSWGYYGCTYFPRHFPCGLFQPSPMVGARCLEESSWLHILFVHATRAHYGFSCLFIDTPWLILEHSLYDINNLVLWWHTWFIELLLGGVFHMVPSWLSCSSHHMTMFR